MEVPKAPISVALSDDCAHKKDAEPSQTIADYIVLELPQGDASVSAECILCPGLQPSTPEARTITTSDSST